MILKGREFEIFRDAVLKMALDVQELGATFKKVRFYLHEYTQEISPWDGFSLTAYYDKSGIYMPHKSYKLPIYRKFNRYRAFKDNYIYSDDFNRLVDLLSKGRRDYKAVFSHDEFKIMKDESVILTCPFI